MTVQQLQTVYRAQPFKPFTIRMADGRSFLIPHSEYLSFSKRGRTVVIHHLTDDEFSIIDLMLMTEIQVHDGNNEKAA
ncbi:hypothetical protein [Mucisphaera sp.]|uniref:hypothetical protein n=1 Tax=Mucisphaera sp. TaxID=2913024 RepID=UPI003D0C6DEA